MPAGSWPSDPRKNWQNVAAWKNSRRRSSPISKKPAGSNRARSTRRPRHLPNRRVRRPPALCLPGGSIGAGCGLIPVGKRWKSCVIRSGSPSPFSVRFPAAGHRLSNLVRCRASGLRGVRSGQLTRKQKLPGELQGLALFRSHPPNSRSARRRVAPEIGEMKLAIEIPPKFGTTSGPDAVPKSQRGSTHRCPSMVIRCGITSKRFINFTWPISSLAICTNG